MKLPLRTLAITSCLFLAACGGGGEDAPPTANPPTMDISDFAGEWRALPGVAGCWARFNYNTSHFYRFRSVSITPASDRAQITATADVFQDNLCSIKLGKIEEHFTANLSQGLSAARSNVVKMTATFSGSSVGPDGGLGINLTSMPDGSLSGLASTRLLMDRDGDRLYVTRSEDAVSLDVFGFPEAINDDTYLTR